ncbi:MAG: transposase [Stigonema ocellatum SAG 48.90 = DSM 106950]|nr:transposase [Stigonema ocellatum SAG 48.90 = DSM 106950]
MVNTIFTRFRIGCFWEMIPQGFPPYSTVYFYFRRR